MSRQVQTESGYVQTFVRSKFFVRSSCVRRQICPDHPRPKQYMSRLSCVLVQTIVRLCPDHPAFKSRPSCVHVQTFVRSPDRKKNYILGCSVSRPCNFERTTPPSCVHFGLDISGFGLGPQPGHAFIESEKITTIKIILGVTGLINVIISVYVTQDCC